MFCRQCGNQLRDQDRFCQVCGKEVKSVSGSDSGPNGTEILPQIKNGQVYLSANNGKKTADIKKKKNFLPWIIAGGGLIVICIIVIVGVTVFGNAQKKYDRQLALGAKYLDELNYEKAISVYKAILDVDPKNEEVLELLEKAYMGWAESEPDRAVDIYTEAIEYIGSFDGKETELMVADIQDRITQAETDTDQISANEETDQTQESSAYTFSLSVISAATEEKISGVNISIHKTDDTYKEDKKMEDNGKVVVGGLEAGQYTIKASADGFNDRELTVNVDSDRNILLAMAPVMSGDDACVLMEWDGEMDVDLCAFNAKLKEYVNSSRVMDSDGNMFLYDINKADEGFELLYIHNIGSEDVKTIYVLDRAAAQAGASSSMEADGVRVYIYTSDGEVFHSTATRSQNAPLWAPCYIYEGEVYDLGDYITDLSDYQWISLNEADQVVEQKVSDREWKQAYLQAIKDLPDYDTFRIEKRDINNDNIPELFINGDYDYSSYIYSYVNGKVYKVADDSCGGLYYIPGSGKVMFYCEGGDYSGESYSLYTLSERGYTLTGSGGIYRSVPEWESGGLYGNHEWVKVHIEGMPENTYEAYEWKNISYYSWSDCYAAMNRDFDFNKAGVFTGNLSHNELVRYLSE